MWMTKVLTDEEKEKIREAKREEREYTGYLLNSIRNMQTKKSNCRLREVKRK